MALRVGRQGLLGGDGGKGVSSQHIKLQFRDVNVGEWAWLGRALCVPFVGTLSR